MYTCEICGFETGRLANFKRHMNRKNPCKSPDPVNAGKCSVNAMVNVLDDSVNVLDDSVNARVNAPIEGISKKYICEICNKAFNSKQGKYQHKKNVKCKPPPVVCQPIVVETQPPQSPEAIDDSTTCPYCEITFSRIDNLKRHMTRCRLNNSGGNINTTNNNTINSNHLNDVNSGTDDVIADDDNPKKPDNENEMIIEESQVPELQEMICMLKNRRRGFTESTKKKSLLSNVGSVITASALYLITMW